MGHRLDPFRSLRLHRNGEPVIEVRWMLPPGSNIAHAFRVAELSSGASEITAIRFCGTWPVVYLIENEFTERCRVCQRAITEEG
jgi:hypothetical protein